MNNKHENFLKKKMKKTKIKNSVLVTKLLKNIPKIKQSTIVDVPEKSESSFESLQGYISHETMLGIESFGFKDMTEIQKLTIPLILSGNDVQGTAPTGSGKTLAFAIPTVEKIRNDLTGVGCIILSPARELAIQTHSVLEKLCIFHKNITIGLIIGGMNVDRERQQIKEGINIMVATPGRLLDHLQHSKHLVMSKLKFLVIDEADRLLDEGFEEQVNHIFNKIQKSSVPVQTVLFSATRAPNVTKMARLALSGNYKDVNVINSSRSANNQELSETYIVYPTFLKLLFLHKILSENKDKKIMVFMNSCDQVSLYRNIFLKFGFKVDGIQSRLTQSQRTERFKSFEVADNYVTLFCTNVAARGWDIPAVDFVIHYDPPSSVQEYIHRIGRGCRREGEKSTSVLFLRDEELKFLDTIRITNRELKEYDGADLYSLNYDFESQVLNVVSSDKKLSEVAVSAYKSFLTSYNVLPKDAFENRSFVPVELCKVFGLKLPPSYDFDKKIGRKTSALKYKAHGKKNSNKKIKRF